MTTLIQSLRKKASLFLLPLGIFMLAISISSSAGILITPACDGVKGCTQDSDCGTKCICHPGDGGICLDNT